MGTTVSSIFALYYHHLQGYLCQFISEEEFKKSLRDAMRMLLPHAL